MKYLELKWTISRARETEGYNVVTLIDERKKFKAMGGGYDMVGTVFGQWLQHNYLEKLEKLPSAGPHGDKEGFYGLFHIPNCSVRLDGACGIDCMIKIAKALGLEVKTIWKDKTGYVGIMVNEKGKDEPRDN